jgi:hypothetical protein
MFKILTQTQSHNWISILDDVLNTYNNIKFIGNYCKIKKLENLPLNLLELDCSSNYLTSFNNLPINLH